MVDLSLAVSSKQGKKQRYEFMRESIISGFKYLKESKKKKSTIGYVKQTK